MNAPTTFIMYKSRYVKGSWIADASQNGHITEAGIYQQPNETRRTFKKRLARMSWGTWCFTFKHRNEYL